jgi:membrane-associated phospholipid phosphatase
MNSILDAGLKIILFIQNLGTWLSGPMQFLSFLGNEQFFLLTMPIFLWCIDMTTGLRLGFLLLISGNLNYILKLVFHGPRPYWVDRTVRAYTSEPTFGIPSGHAQVSASVWGGLAYSFRKPWLWLAAGLAVFLIGLSRLYNGVHFPTDVLAGWIIGALVLWICMNLEKPVTAWLLSCHLSIRLAAALVFSLSFILLGVLSRISLGAWALPQTWATNAAAGAPGSAPITPLSLSSLISSAGALFGLSAGAILLPVWGGFNVRGPVGKRALRFLAGMVGMLIIWGGLGLILPGGESRLILALRYLRYALTGFWISGLAPLMFTHTGLAEKN